MSSQTSLSRTSLSRQTQSGASRSFEKIVVSVVLFGITLFGCTPHSTARYESLLDQGVLPVSTTNAFVGSNLFLSGEFERSRVLLQFLKGRGAPLAIEIKQANSIKLYYPKEREYFLGSLLKSETQYDWIMRGPFRMSREDFLKVSELTKVRGEPLFQSRGKELRFGETVTAPPVVYPTLQPTVPTPKPVKKKKPAVITDKGGSSPAVAISVATPTPEANPSKFTYDQMAIQMSRGFAERSPGGDVIHTVKREGETINDIAAWYCGDKSKAPEIAATHGVGADTPLVVGARITLPEALVKEFKAMK